MLIFLFGIIFIFIIISIILLILYLIGNYKLFQKAGYNGWESLIPFYNNWLLIKISGLNQWYFLLLISSSITFIPSLSLLSPLTIIAVPIARFFCYYNISKKLHQDILFTVLLFLFPIIVVPIIGISKKYQFDNNVIVSPHGPIETKSSTNQSTNIIYCKYCKIKLNSNSNFCPNCGKKTNEN